MKITSKTKKIPLNALVLILTLTGCFTNTGGQSTAKSSKTSGNTSSSGTTTATPVTSTGDQFKIANVIVSVNGNNTTAAIYLDPTKSIPAVASSGAPYISNHCSNAPAGGGASAKPCTCRFAWTEVSTSGGTTLSYARSVETTVTNAQQSLLNCPAPDVYTKEITDGTSIKVTISPASGNNDVFTIPTFAFTKNSSNSVGSFKDAEGRSFDNILHYACYERSNRGGGIVSRVKPENNRSDGRIAKVPLANKFCVSKPGSAVQAGCEALPPSKPSIQSNYYNFFIRASEAGDINQWNDGYSCPVVKEALGNSPTNIQSNFWPMDTNFALSIGRSADFNVGVDAFVELANGGNDPVSVNAKSCSGQVGAGNASTNGFVQGCLGFATKPNSDGSCPYFRDSSNQIKFTYRLRRYIAVYPPVFQVGGQPSTVSQSTDAIYVLDRPVTPPNGSDPYKPYAMRGPKPCNFAYFDSNAVASSASRYVAANDTRWSGKNLDGVSFPSTDVDQKSCAAVFPFPNADGTAVSLGTLAFVPTQGPLYVRPQQPWAPHYEEDEDFKACAPQSSVVRDPPLHFAKNAAGNIAWCSESYPSQNDHMLALDRPIAASSPVGPGNPLNGTVAPFTSHLVKNSNSLACAATIPATMPTGTAYPAGGLARHANTVAAGAGLTDICTGAACATTCDRTATNSNGWDQFPLLAPAVDVESMLVSDASYTCAVTYDGGGLKSINKQSPADGCCSTSLTVALRTGIVVPNLSTANTAHLEPDVACLQPKY